MNEKTSDKVNSIQEMLEKFRKKREKDKKKLEKKLDKSKKKRKKELNELLKKEKEEITAAGEEKAGEKENKAENVELEDVIKKKETLDEEEIEEELSVKEVAEEEMTEEEKANKKEEGEDISKEEIIEVIKDHPEGIKLVDIGEELGVHYIAIANKVRELVDSDKLIKDDLLYRISEKNLKEEDNSN